MNVFLDCCGLPNQQELLDWINHLELVHDAPEEVTDVLLSAIVTGHEPSLLMSYDVPPRVVGLRVPLV